MWDLKKECTKVLLKWLGFTRKFGGFYDPTNNKGQMITQQEIKKELSTREHVLNKKESKELRKSKIKKSK